MAGTSGGYTRFVPAEDHGHTTRSQFKAMLASALGGLAAELRVLDEISRNAADDVQRATDIARWMITQLGMSERLGVVAGGAEAVDDEIRRLVDEARIRAVSLLNAHCDLLHRLALELIRKESLDSRELERIFRRDDGQVAVDASPEIRRLPSHSHESAA